MGLGFFLFIFYFQIFINQIVFTKSLRDLASFVIKKSLEHTL